jgi:hypothetical protein
MAMPRLRALPLKIADRLKPIQIAPKVSPIAVDNPLGSSINFFRGLSNWNIGVKIAIGKADAHRVPQGFDLRRANVRVIDFRKAIKNSLDGFVI